MTSEEGGSDPYSYYVNLCRPLVPMPGKKCAAGAWACRIDIIENNGDHLTQVKLD